MVVAYREDNGNLVALAMNGWGAAEPARWLNLQARPEATVQTRDGSRRVRARVAEGDERERLWARWAESSARAEISPTDRHPWREMSDSAKRRRRW